MSKFTYQKILQRDLTVGEAIVLQSAVAVLLPEGAQPQLATVAFDGTPRITVQYEVEVDTADAAGLVAKLESGELDHVLKPKEPRAAKNPVEEPIE